MMFILQNVKLLVWILSKLFTSKKGFSLIRILAWHQNLKLLTILNFVVFTDKALHQNVRLPTVLILYSVAVIGSYDFSTVSPSYKVLHQNVKLLTLWILSVHWQSFASIWRFRLSMNLYSITVTNRFDICTENVKLLTCLTFVIRLCVNFNWLCLWPVTSNQRCNTYPPPPPLLHWLKQNFIVILSYWLLMQYAKLYFVWGNQGGYMQVFMASHQYVFWAVL